MKIFPKFEQTGQKLPRLSIITPYQGRETVLRRGYYKQHLQAVPDDISSTSIPNKFAMLTEFVLRQHTVKLDQFVTISSFLFHFFLYFLFFLFFYSRFFPLFFQH